MTRRRNTQEQNAETLASIRQLSRTPLRDSQWRDWMPALLTSGGLDPSKGILVRLECIPEQEGEFFSGLWLTEEGRFWEFSAIVSRATGTLLSVEALIDVTSTTNVSARNRGYGAAFGFLALQVLSESRGA